MRRIFPKTQLGRPRFILCAGKVLLIRMPVEGIGFRATESYHFTINEQAIRDAVHVGENTVISIPPLSLLVAEHNRATRQKLFSHLA